MGRRALTPRGMGQAEMRLIGGWIDRVLKDRSEKTIQEVAAEVGRLTEKFPLYESLLQGLSVKAGIRSSGDQGAGDQVIRKSGKCS